MNQEIKTKWVNALRSGKYKQGRKYLFKLTPKDPRYCCLGVLCDLAKKEHIDTTHTSLHMKNKVLPLSVQIWAGITTCDPWVDYSSIQKCKLSILNDRNRLGFKTIATLIEKSL